MEKSRKTFRFVRGLDRPVYGVCPPMMDSSSNKVEGLAFIGLSLSRRAPDSSGIDVCCTLPHPGSATRQTQFDFDELQDRQYRHFCSSNDDGWLVGGGEGEESYKLPSPDSAHCGEGKFLRRVSKLSPTVVSYY